MEIILLENILNLGNIGDTVKVKNGYGRNLIIKHLNLIKKVKKTVNYMVRLSLKKLQISLKKKLMLK